MENFPVISYSLMPKYGNRMKISLNKPIESKQTDKAQNSYKYIKAAKKCKKIKTLNNIYTAI